MADNISLSELIEVGNKISKEIFHFTPQLFVKPKKNLPPFAFSSSILLTVNNKFYLITAAHTFYNENVDKIGICINDVFCKLGGSLIYSEPNDTINYDPNKLDMAVFELHNDTSEFLKTKYRFLPLSELAFDHVSSKHIRYLICGFPAIETSKNFPTKEVFSSTFSLASHGADPDVYLNNKIDINKTIILPIIQNKIETTSIRNTPSLPELEGISGCGVWVVSNLLSKMPNFKLVSIITGINYDKSVLYSSRIDTLKIILQNGFNHSDF
jgi:hypothetical protein